MSLVSVRDLVVDFSGTRVVDGLSLDLEPGGRIGLIGESGSGKSMTALALMGLVPAQASVSGSIQMNGVELTRLGRSTRARHRARHLGMVFQEPLSALDPWLTIRAQVREAHALAGAPHDRASLVAALHQVDLSDAERILAAHPHELSGGQRQRVLMAMALAGNPELVIADEPTTALDTTVQQRVLATLSGRLAQTGAANIFITHDLAVAAAMCDQVLVLLHGRVVEQGPVDQVLADPRHEYTQALVAGSELDRFAPHSLLPVWHEDAPSAASSAGDQGQEPA